MLEGSNESDEVAYIVNGLSRITAEPGERGLRWRVEAPVPGEGLRVTVVEAADRPELHELFVAIGGDRGDVVLDGATAFSLRDLGVLVLADRQPRPVRFSVPLTGDDEPSPHPASLRINERTRLASAPTHDLFEQGPTVEVVDPDRGIELAYWLDDDDVATIADLLAGDRSVIDLPPRDISALRAARVLLDDRSPEAAPVTLAETRGLVAKVGHVTVPSLLPHSYVQALQRFVRELVAQGYLMLGDAQSPRRYVAHNDAVSMWLHHRVLAAVRPRVPIPVRASYSYLIAYLEGAELPAHTDRAQCEYTLSLALDASPDESLDGAWPLHLADDRGSPVEVCRLAPGDAVLFAGRRLTHHRDALAAGHTSTSLLLHFVHEAYAGPLD